MIYLISLGISFVPSLTSMPCVVQMKMNRGELDDQSDLDDGPMASQSADVEAPLTHNSSKNNFYPSSGDEQQQQQPSRQKSRGSFKVTLCTLQFMFCIVCSWDCCRYIQYKLIVQTSMSCVNYMTLYSISMIYALN